MHPVTARQKQHCPKSCSSCSFRRWKYPPHLGSDKGDIWPHLSQQTGAVSLPCHFRLSSPLLGDNGSVSLLLEVLRHVGPSLDREAKAALWMAAALDELSLVPPCFQKTFPTDWSSDIPFVWGFELQKHGINQTWAVGLCSIHSGAVQLFQLQQQEGAGM